MFESLASAYLHDGGDVGMAVRCLMASLTLVVSPNDELRLRCKLGLLLLNSGNGKAAFEHLERAFRSAKRCGDGRMMIVAGLAAVDCGALSSQIAETILLEALEIAGAEHNYNLTLHILVKLFGITLDGKRLIQIIDGCLTSIPGGDIRDTIIAWKLCVQTYHGFVDASILEQYSELSMNTTCQSAAVMINLMLALHYSIIGLHARTEAHLGKVLECRLEQVECLSTLTLFPSGLFKYLVRALCIAHSAVDGKQPYREIMTAIERTAGKCPDSLKQYYELIMTLLLLQTGRLEMGGGERLYAFSNEIDTQIQAYIRDSSCKPHLGPSNVSAFCHVEFINACHLLMADAPFHQVKYTNM